MKKKMMLLIGGIGMLVMVDIVAMSPRILKLNSVHKRMYCDKKVAQRLDNKWVGKGIYLSAKEMAKLKQDFARKDELISDLQEELQIKRQQLALVQQELDDIIFKVY